MVAVQERLDMLRAVALTAWMAWACGGPATVACMAEPPAGGKPEALLHAERARSAERLRAARIEWSLRDPGAEWVYKDPRFYSWRCAGDVVANTFAGDAEGVCQRTPEGAPYEGSPFNGPPSAMLLEGRIWEHIERDIAARVWSADPQLQRDTRVQLFDMRRLGLNPVSWRLETLEEIIRAAGGAPLTYQAEVEDGLHVVSANSGKLTFRWWIDPQKDWAVLRTAIFDAGRKVAEDRYHLRRFDGIWFPERVECFNRLSDAVPFRVLEVHRVEFNRPEHPRKLTPADIGIEVGMTVRDMDDPRQPVYVWDGKGLVSHADFNARLAAGELEISPVLLDSRAQLKAWVAERGPDAPSRLELPSASATPPPPASGPAATQPRRWVYGFESDWERYTREFIAKYRLDAEQAQRAWSICRDCQRLALEYAERRRAEFEKLDEAAGELASLAPQLRETRRLEVEQRRRELMAPIERIFEQRLVPRLEWLPTRAQRERAREGQVGSDSPGSARSSGGP